MIKKLKNIEIITVVIISSLLAFTVCTVSAYATQASVSGDIVFAQKLVSVNGQDMDQTYNYVLEADSSSYPMPEGSKNNKFEFSMSGNTNFPLKINYTTAGVYTYKAYMLQPPSKEYYSYDDAVYTIEAYVTNVEPDALKLTFNYKNKDCEKLQNPSWTVTMDCPIPEPQSSQFNPEYPSWFSAKTLDITYFVTIFAIAMILICGILYILNQKKHKK